MTQLTLEDAQTIVAAALKKARDLELNPMSIAVLDSGGHLKAFVREDGPGGALRPKVAVGKAFAAIGMGSKGSRLWEKTAAERPAFVQGLIGLADGKFVPGRGGVIVLDSAGEAIGAVGCSGDLPDNDEAVVVAGIQAAGLNYDTGE